MKKVLLNIDYTVDFIVGALPCGDAGVTIEQEIAIITEKFIENGDYVVFAIDLHHQDDPYHPETILFPPHNILGTDGRKLYGKLERVYEKYKNANNVYWMDKTRYSAFAGTDLEIQLRSRNIAEVHLVGVCTDICILHTAIDAYNKGFQVFIHEKGVASFNSTGHDWALQHFKRCLNATII